MLIKDDLRKIFLIQDLPDEKLALIQPLLEKEYWQKKQIVFYSEQNVRFGKYAQKYARFDGC